MTRFLTARSFLADSGLYAVWNTQEFESRLGNYYLYIQFFLWCTLMIALRRSNPASQNFSAYLKDLRIKPESGSFAEEGKDNFRLSRCPWHTGIGESCHRYTCSSACSCFLERFVICLSVLRALNSVFSVSTPIRIQCFCVYFSVRLG